jgi:hypothetical protein
MNNLSPAIQRAENDVMDYARKKAIEYSSNTAYKLPSRKGYAPYRKGGGKGTPPLPSFQINMQSGAFSRSWYVNTQKTPQGYTSSIWNDRPYAKYMRGTSKMIARPILQKVGEDVRKYRRKVEPEAIRKAMRNAG